MDMHELVTLRAAYTRAQKDALALFRLEFKRLIQQPEHWGPLWVRADDSAKINEHRTLFGEVRLRTPSEPFCSLLTYGFVVQARVRDAHGELYNVSSEQERDTTTLLVWSCSTVDAVPDCETPLDWSELRRCVARQELEGVKDQLVERREELRRLREEYRELSARAHALREAAKRK